MRIKNYSLFLQNVFVPVAKANLVETLKQNRGIFEILCWRKAQSTYFWLMNCPNLLCQKLRDLG